MKEPEKPTVPAWIQLKEFVELYYPETEIISINPIGLKGLFRDEYTETMKQSF